MIEENDLYSPDTNPLSKAKNPLRGNLNLPSVEDDTGDDIIVLGMGDVLANTKFVSSLTPKFRNPTIIEIIGSTRSIGESVLNEARRLQQDKRDMDRISTYFNAKGWGLQRVILWYFAVTGKEMPQHILENYLFYKNYVQEGWYDTKKKWNFNIDMKGATAFHEERIEDFLETQKTKDGKPIFKRSAQQLKDAMFKSGKVKKIDVDEEDDGWFADNTALLSESMIFDMALHHAEPIGKYVPDASSPYQPTDEQVDAIEEILGGDKRLVVLIGEAGTGKSVTLGHVLRCVDKGANPTDPVAIVVAPTGIASKRVASTGTIPVERCVTKPSTIHSFGYRLYKALSDYDDKAPAKRFVDDVAKAKILIVDESSMVDSTTMALLLVPIRQAFKKVGADFEKLKVVLTGDGEQLEPVGSGRIFVDLIELGETIGMRIKRLTKVLRTDDASIIEAFKAVRENKMGIFSKVAGDRIEIISKREEDDTYIALCEMLNSNGEKWWRNTMILTHTNKVVNLLNGFMYKTLTGMSFDHFAPWNWEGAKVVFTDNDYKLGVVNGDIGEVVEICAEHAVVNLYMGNTIQVPIDYPSVALAFAMSVHKSQGSEADHVYYLHRNTMETKRLVYTAITRAKKEFHVISSGQPNWSNDPVGDVPTILKLFMFQAGGEG